MYIPLQKRREARGERRKVKRRKAKGEEAKGERRKVKSKKNRRKFFPAIFWSIYVYKRSVH